MRKIDPAKLRLRATRVPRLRLLGSGRRRVLVGRVRSVALPFAIPGKVVAEWQQRRGGRWRKIHGAARATPTARSASCSTCGHGGQWRVRVVYRGQRPYRRSSSRWIAFRVR